MLAIRLSRVGRKAYPVYRIAVQEAWRHPSSGRVVAYVGTYNPHTKEANVQVEAAQKYLDNGAQPTPRVVKLLKDAGVKLPKWVKEAPKREKAVKNAEKLRKNQPKEEPAAEVPTEEKGEEAAEAPAEEAPAEEAAAPEVAPAEEKGEAASEEAVEK